MRGISRGGTYEIYVEQWFYVNEVPLADPGGGGGHRGHVPLRFGQPRLLPRLIKRLALPARGVSPVRTRPRP